MFYLYQHHDLEALAELLAALRLRSPTANALTPETVVVPNRGTARWLQAQLAESEGVAANLALPVPGRFIWRMLRDALPGKPDSAPYEREHLVWHLYAVLPELDIPEVARYLATPPQERQRYQLALRLADVFDQYLIHRRDVLVDWEHGREAGTAPARWQAPIWRALVGRLGERHRARLLAEFLALAERGDIDPSNLPNPLYAFALADLPADYLRLLYALAHYVDVHYLLPNPSVVYWGDAQRRSARASTFAAPPAATDPPSNGLAIASAASDAGINPLLASLGRAGRDFLKMLYSGEFPAIHEPELGAPLAYREPGADSLLHRVQSAIIRGSAAVSESPPDDHDRSLQIHACHGPLREMQVLHDRLLDLLRRDEQVEPRGILVLLPDVARYAPAIHAVFGGAWGARWLPYSIADKPRLDTHPIVQTFQKLIELPLSRWGASEVLALAAVPAVMRRFELDDEDQTLLHRWTSEAGIRWGLDAQTRSAVGAAPFEQNTWRFGLDRLLLGLAQREDGALVDDVAPWSDLEGGPATAVGRLWLFVARLRDWRDTLQEPALAAVWQERLNTMAADLFALAPDDADEATALETVTEAVAGLEIAAHSLAETALSWEAVREALIGALASGSQRQPLVTGGVTFAGLEPLRGVPFDVICMAGVDDDTFPAQDAQRAFNLLRQQPRPGDPSRRDNDRMAFLQALLAAQKYFYLSYTGHDLADGAELQPSAVVGELLDYLRAYHCADCPRAGGNEAIITQQPMHAFSPRYFQTDATGLFTYTAEWRDAAQAQRAPRRASCPFLDDTALPAPDVEQTIDLADLQRFFQHPARWFFRECLRLQLDETDTALSDEEPRALDNLARHQLRERLFTHAKETGSTELAAEPQALERALGRLPPPPLGRREYAEGAAAVNALLPIYWHWQNDATDAASVAIDLTLAAGDRLSGSVPMVGATTLRRLRPGRLRLTHLLPWWLEYLAVVATGRPIALQLAGIEDRTAEQLLGQVDPETAQDYLATAVRYYRHGQTRPMLFEPYLAEDYLARRAQKSAATRERKTPTDALNQVNNWLNDTYRPHHALRDPWLQPLFAAPPARLGADPQHATLVALAEHVAAPIWAHLAPPETAP